MIKNSIKRIESILASTYRFDPLVSASDFLVSAEELNGMGFSMDKRAAVVFDDSSTEFFIGLFIDEEIKKLIQQDDPTLSLHNQNLDALCATAEEISHFHLILQRKFHELSTNIVELEWQAEIDKLLVSSKLLFEQHGKSHVKQLRRHLYEEGIVSLDHDPTYAQANDLAARFWHLYESLPKRERELAHCPILDELLFKFYRADFGEKHSLLGQIPSIAA